MSQSRVELISITSVDGIDGDNSKSTGKFTIVGKL